MCVIFTVTKHFKYLYPDGEILLYTLKTLRESMIKKIEAPMC